MWQHREAAHRSCLLCIVDAGSGLTGSGSVVELTGLSHRMVMRGRRTEITFVADASNTWATAARLRLGPPPALVPVNRGGHAYDRAHPRLCLPALQTLRLVDGKFCHFCFHLSRYLTLPASVISQTSNSTQTRQNILPATHLLPVPIDDH